MSADPAQIDVPLCRGKILLLLVVALMFIALGFWLWKSEEADQRRDPIFTKAVSVACIGFFGSCAIMGLVKLFDPRPGLSIDQRGITDNSSGFSFGFLKWEDIVEVDVTRVKATKILLIYVSNPQYNLCKMNPVKRWVLYASQKMYGTPFSISSNTLSVDFSTLVSIVKSGLSKHRG